MFNVQHKVLTLQTVSCRGLEVWQFSGDPAPLARDNMLTKSAQMRVHAIDYRLGGVY